MRTRLARTRARTAAESGFTMIVTILVLLVVTSLSIAAFTAASGDVHSNAYSNAEKQAVAAAQAGLAWYQSQLTQDPNYWTKCTNVSALSDGPAPVENPWNGVSSRPWRSIPGTTQQYVVDLLPVPGKSACDTSDPAGSMIDSTTGTFRIRVTGRARNDPTAPRRSIIATFRRKGFLDFIYYTSVDAEDPNLYAANNIALWLSSNGYSSATPDPVAWIKTNCGTQWQNGRGTAKYSGTATKSGGGTATVSNAAFCPWADIQFANADVVAGPLHTQDSILVCNSPTFGRTSQDTEEIEAPTSAPPVRAASGCSANPTWKGTYKPGAASLSLPPSNGSLGTEVTTGYRFTGTTYITFGSPSAGQMTVSNANMGLSNVAMTQPTNGVIYVANGTCGVSYDVNNPYPNTPGCGDVYVNGTYTQNMTINAEKDILINGNVQRSGDVLLGLIANNYVRVYHPVSQNNGCSNNGYTPPNPLVIQAAMLTVTGSFLVDNWGCNTLGTLNVVGAIAQKFRGIVGSGGSGYIKNYQYDDRLHYRSPPNFLDPVQTSWKIVRIVEQSPAT